MSHYITKSPGNTALSRIHQAKQILTPTRSSNYLKNVFRREFLTRLKESRNKNVDRFRRIVEDLDDKVTYSTIQELRNLVLTKGGEDLMKTEEVILFLEQVENDFKEAELENEARQYEQMSESEVDDIVSRLSSICSICGDKVTRQEICAACAGEFI